MLFSVFCFYQTGDHKHSWPYLLVFLCNNHLRVFWILLLTKEWKSYQLWFPLQRQRNHSRYWRGESRHSGWHAWKQNRNGYHTLLENHSGLLCCWLFQTHKFILPPHRAISLNRPFCHPSFYMAESRAVVSIYWAPWRIKVGFPLLFWRRREKVLKPEAGFAGGWRRDHLNYRPLGSWLTVLILGQPPDHQEYSWEPTVPIIMLPK